MTGDQRRIKYKKEKDFKKYLDHLSPKIEQTSSDGNLNFCVAISFFIQEMDKKLKQFIETKAEKYAQLQKEKEFLN